MVFNIYKVLFIVVVAIVVLYGYIVLTSYKNRNKFPYGTGIATWYEKERIKSNLFFKLDYIMYKIKAIHVVKKYYNLNGSNMNISEAKIRLKEIVNQLLENIVAEYPATHEYINKMPEIFVKSNYFSLKKASKDFNATSYHTGVTGLNVAYLLKYINSKDENEKKMWVTLTAQVLFHEVSHHQFRLDTGFHILKKHSEQLMYHIDEYYADLRSFEIMKLNKSNANNILELKAKHTPNILDMKQFKTYHTHPSRYCRKQFVANGSFNIYSIIWAADMINISKNKEYIKAEDIKFVAEKISEFERKHPEVTVEFELL